MSKVDKKKIKKQKKIIRNIGIVFSLILFVSSIVFDIFVGGVNVLPNKYFLPLVLISNLFIILFSIVLIKPKFRIWFKVIIMLMGMFFCIIFWIGCSYINKTYHFMDKIRSQGMITETYYVVVNKDSKYTKIDDLKDKKIGTFDEQIDIYDMAIKELSNKIKYESVEYKSVLGMSEELLDENVDAIIISAYHKDSIEESIENFKDGTKIIDTIEVKVKEESSKQADVNVMEETFTIYVSGIDQYGDISTRSRSDVNMLVTVNTKNHEILLTSIPRDYYVQLHDTTGYKDKLTHAGIYGINMSVNTIQDFLDINIDYYVRVNFSTLIDVVDIIGGIDVYSDKGFIPWTNTKLYIPEGNVHMNGAMALAFARERYTYQEGDRHRVQNQQDVITAIIKKVTSSTTILTKYTTLLDELSNSFETNIKTSTITTLMKHQLDKMPSWTIKNYSLNGSDSYDYTYSAGMQKLYVMIPDKETVAKAKEYIDGMENGKTLKELGLE